MVPAGIILAMARLGVKLAKHDETARNGRGSSRARGAVLPWVLAALLVGSGMWGLARPNVIPKNFGVVEEGRVYRSGELTPAAMERVVREHHIKTIIDLGAFEPGTAGELRMSRTAKALGVDRFLGNLEGDARGNPNYYLQALKIMSDPARQPVLVHCGAGSERTGCIVAIYRNAVQGVPLGEGYEEARHYRHDPRRNPHLKEVLDLWGAKVVEAFKTGRPLPGADPLAPMPLNP